MKILDIEINDIEDKALFLLNSILDTNDHLITTLLCGKDLIEFDDVFDALTNNEYCKKDKRANRDIVC